MRSRDEITLRDQQAPLAQYQPTPGAMSPYSHTGAPSAAAEPSIIKAVLRHFWMVILFAVIGAGGAYAFIKYARPLYTAEATINIQPQSNVPMVNLTLGSAQRSSYLYTQAAIIHSDTILRLLLEKPEIVNLETFKLANGDMLKYLNENLVAEVDRKTDLVVISIETPFIEDAPKIVNAVVDAYSKYQQMDKNTTASAVVTAFRSSLGAAEEQKKALETDLNQFKTRFPGVEIGMDAAVRSQFLSFRDQLTAAQIASIQASASYGPTHPAVARAHQVEEQLSIRLQETMDLAAKTTAQAGQYQKKLSDLESTKQLITQLTTKISDMETAQRISGFNNDVQVIDPARIPERPSFPKKTRTMAAAIFIGALLGAGLALLRDRMDTTMRSVEEIQTVVGMPILGVVPAMSGRRTAIARAMTVHLDPRSVVAEAYRTIRTAVYFGTNNARCKTILMTSPEPGDGKTTSASNLAIAIAQTGRTVLLLDADFRKPTQHKNLDIKDTVGLSSVLSGRETLERAIQNTGVDGLHILPCGPIPANPSEILNSREFGELIDSLAVKYDHIIFDSPPVNAVTDARILGAVCDATILVLRADKSTRKSGEHARNALMAVGANVLGAIVNDAPNCKGYEVYGGSYYGNVEVHMSPRVSPSPVVTDGKLIGPPGSEKKR